MEYAVKLACLPAGATFSERIRDRIRFDPERRELIYSGFMTKCAYDEISAVSDELDYHRAIEQLFIMTSAEVAPPKRGFPTAIVVGTTAAVMVAAVLLWGTTRYSSTERSVNPPTARPATASPATVSPPTSATVSTAS